MNKSKEDLALERKVIIDSKNLIVDRMRLITNLQNYHPEPGIKFKDYIARVHSEMAELNARLKEETIRLAEFDELHLYSQ